MGGRRDLGRVPLESLKLFDQAAYKDPLYVRGHLWRGIAMLKADRRDPSLVHFGRARWVSRGYADVNLLIGQISEKTSALRVPGYTYNGRRGRREGHRHPHRHRE